MNVPKLKAFCRGFPGAAETQYGEPYNFLVYSVGGKKFAYSRRATRNGGVSALAFHLIASSS